MPKGHIEWRDLTVPDAEVVRDFYAEVVGWTYQEHDIGGEYADYNMIAPDGEVVTGICWARSTNAGVPAQWLMYVTVDNVALAAEKAVALGGRIVDGPRKMGGGDFAVVQDPAGAVVALYCADPA